MIHIFIFIFLLLVIFITLFIFIFRKKACHESFTINTTVKKKLPESNLLKNSSFENGNNITEFEKKSGNADIIVFPNPGVTEYVLRQSKNDKISFQTPIFYQIKTTLKYNRIYAIKCLYYSTNNLPLIHRIEYKDMMDSSIFLKSLTDCKKGNNFDTMYTLFKVPENKNKSVEVSSFSTSFKSSSQTETTEVFISLMYNLNNFKGYNYLTDVILEEVKDIYNLPITKFLRIYLNVFHPKSIDSSNNLINDLSGNNLNFVASKEKSIQLNNVELLNNVLTGPNSFITQNEGRLWYSSSFTFFILVKGVGMSINDNITESFTDKMVLTDPKIDEFSNDKTTKQTVGITILRIVGNENTSLELVIPEKYGYIYLVAAGEIYKSQVQIFSSMENLFTVAYKSTAGIFLYLNGELILKTVCPKIYFNNPPITINPLGNFAGNFYIFAYYRTYLLPKDIIELTKYFMRVNSCQIEAENPLLNNNLEDFILNSNISEEEEMNIQKDKNALSEIKKDIEREKIFNEICPKVIYENEHYHAIIPNGSKLANEIGYSGIRDYGMDIDNAKKIFEINFPKCKVPDILDKTKYKPKLDNCPFIMLKPENPCYQYECRKTDWTKGIPDNSYCKRSIDVYCSKYSDIDPACYCWKNENKNKPECLKWRGNFEAEDKCDFRKFKIEEHPDSKDYIKKSKIPCWGCNLDAPEPIKSNCEYNDRKGSGAR